MNFSAIRTTVVSLWPYARKRLWLTLFVVGSVILRNALVLVEPYFFQWLLELFQQYLAGTLQNVLFDAEVRRLIFWFVLVQLMLAFTFGLQFYSINRFQVAVLREASTSFIDHVLNLSFRFHSNRKTGTLSKEFARGISAIEGFMDVILFNFLPLIVTVIGTVFVFGKIDWRFAAILVALVVVFATFTFVVSLRLQKYRQESNDEDDQGTGRVLDSLMNAELVKYYQQEQNESELFRASRSVWVKAKLKEWDSWIVIGSVQMILMGMASAAMLWLLYIGIQEGTIKSSVVVLLVSYISLLTSLLWDVQWYLRRFIESVTDADKFFRYFEHKQEVLDAPNAKPLTVTDGAIAFTNVQFSYSDERQVAKGISFTVPGKTSLALVGPSGVGKSTIVKLLYRFYEPQNGTITIDGQSIAEVTQETLRNQLSIVPQETSLFNETIAYNISYGNPGATQEDVERVAKLAHIHDFILSLPKGYNTVVGERGMKLSGGEKQRISIARALLRNTPIVILDEPTSSLDSASEREIQEALKNLMAQRTVVIIAHRLSTIMSSDQIAVINNGMVAEQGTHDALLAQHGMYHHLWNLQAGGYIPDVDADELDNDTDTEDNAS